MTPLLWYQFSGIIYFSTVLEISDHHGGEDMAEQAAHIVVARKQKRRIPTVAGYLLFPLFFSPRAPRLRDGAGHIQGKSSLLI
jgi:hypothetical protein